jgi:hypothetical protein
VWSIEGTEFQVVLENCRNADVVKPCCMVVGFQLINPLTPDLNPSKQGCLPEFFPGVLNFIAYS